MSWAEEAVLEDAIRKAKDDLEVSIKIDGDIDVTDAMKLEALVKLPSIDRGSTHCDLKNILFYDTTPEIINTGCYVVFDNAIHCFQGDRHYRWDGSWHTYSTTNPVNMSYSSAVVYNNEIHILGGNYSGTDHFKWNGGGWSRVSTLPYSFLNGGCVVYDNKIHILGGSTAPKIQHYSWDGENWESVDTLPYAFENGGCVVYDNKIHILGSFSPAIKDHYTWSQSDGWSSSISTIPYIPYYYTSFIVYNNEIHMISSNVLRDGRSHYKWSTSSGAWVEEPVIPYIGCIGCHSAVYNDELHIFMMSAASTSYGLGAPHFIYDGVEYKKIKADPDKKVSITGVYNDNLPTYDFYRSTQNLSKTWHISLCNDGIVFITDAAEKREMGPLINTSSTNAVSWFNRHVYIVKWDGKNYHLVGHYEEDASNSTTTGIYRGNTLMLPHSSVNNNVYGFYERDGNQYNINTGSYYLSNNQLVNAVNRNDIWAYDDIHHCWYFLRRDQPTTLYITTADYTLTSFTTYSTPFTSNSYPLVGAFYNGLFYTITSNGGLCSYNVLTNTWSVLRGVTIPSTGIRFCAIIKGVIYWTGGSDTTVYRCDIINNTPASSTGVHFPDSNKGKLINNNEAVVFNDCIHLVTLYNQRSVFVDITDTPQEIIKRLEISFDLDLLKK